MKIHRSSKFIILVIITISLLSSCDPINCAIIENKSDHNIEYRLFVNSIEDIVSINEYVYDTTLNCGKIILKPNEEKIIEYGSRIAAPIIKEDLRFKKIELIIDSDTLIFNKSAFYFCMKDRINWPFFAVRNWYFTIK